MGGIETRTCKEQGIAEDRCDFCVNTFTNVRKDIEKMIIPQKKDQKIMIVIDELKIKRENEYSLKNIKDDLNIILHKLDFEKCEEGWYVGTMDSYCSLYSLITKNDYLFNNLLKFIYWDTKKNVYYDCLQEHLQNMKKWGV